jgi:hypothetical protein
MADEQGNYFIATLLAECLDSLDQSSVRSPDASEDLQVATRSTFPSITGLVVPQQSML